MNRDINTSKRDEIIYTQVFNNYCIPSETLIDLTIGSLEEWGESCDKFNRGDMILNFAPIYIIYNTLHCNNVHPFMAVQCHNSNVSHITTLLSKNSL